MKTEIIVDGIYFDENDDAVYVPELEYWSAKNMTYAKRIAFRMLKGKIKASEKCTHVYIWKNWVDEYGTIEGQDSWLCQLSDDGKSIIAQS